MASKVNTKFVVILSAVLVVAVIGVVGLAAFAMSNKGLRSVRQGDKLMAEGNYEDAEKAYGKAVSKDRTNLGWIEKWHEALSHITPDTQTKYEKLYGQHKTALLTKAQLIPTDAGMQEAYIAEEYRFLRVVSGGSRTALERFVDEVEERVLRLDPDSDGAKRILRYRGRALVELMGLTTIDRELREQAADDLGRAMEVDPGDAETEFAQVRWYLLEALRYKGDRDSIEEQRMLDEHDTRLDALIASHPDAPEPRRHKLQYARQMYMLERRDAGESTADAAEVMAPLADELLAAVEASIDDPELVRKLMGVRVTLQQSVGRARADEIAALFERVLDAYPDNTEAMLQAGYALQFAEENKRAIEVLEKLVTKAPQAVSLDGYLQVYHQDRAIGLQVDSYMSIWGAAGDEGEKSEAMSRAKQKLDELRTRLGTRGLTEVLLREAKLAVAEKQYDSAIHKLTEYRGIVGNTLDGLSLLAHCLTQQGNYGEAKVTLEDAIGIYGRYEELLHRLGEVNIQLRGKENLINAYDIYSELVALRPENTIYRRRLGEVGSALSQISDSQGVEYVVEESDVVVERMIAARKLLSDENNADGALVILEELLGDNPGDVRIVMEYVRISVAFGMRDRAIGVVRDAIVLVPDDIRLSNALLQLEAEDPLEGMIAVIRSSAENPLDEHLALYQLFMGQGLTDRARESLQSAIGIAPDDTRVIEADFLLALHDRDMNRADSIALRAAELNADEAGGMLFQGRVEFAEQRYREAAELFAEALEQNPHNPSVRRLLGESQAQLGRLDEARESMMRAHRARPRDVDTLKSLTRVLVMQGRGAEALGYAKLGAQSESSDIEMVEIWLTLAGEHGTDDDKATVERLRRERFETDPSNIQNASALIALLAQREDWDQAMGVIDEMRGVAGIEVLRLISFEAGVLANMEEVDAGVGLFRGFIESNDDPESQLSALLSLARYLDIAGRYEESIESVRQARAYQDPTTLIADRMLGDALFLMSGRARQAAGKEGSEQERVYLAEAADAYNAVLDGGIDNEDVVSAVRKRLAETYLRLGDLGGVERVMAGLTGSAQEDLQMLQLRARMADQSGDRRAAMEVLNRAAELYPNEPSVFLQRAQLNMGDLLTMSREEVDSSRDQSHDADIVADLKYVTEIRPSGTMAWSNLYQFYLLTRGEEAAVQQLREAVEQNPDSEIMRLMLIRQLFTLGEGDGDLPRRLHQEAEQQAKMAAEEHLDDLRWQLATGTVLRKSRRFTEAAPIMKRAYELTPDDDEPGKILAASMLLDCYLQSDNVPEKAQVNPLLEMLELVALEDLNTHEARFDAEGEGWLTRDDAQEERELRDEAQDVVVGMMLIARARSFLEEKDAAITISGRTLGACHGDAALSAAWFDELRVMFGDPDATIDFLTQMDEIGKRRGRQVLTPYLRVVFEGKKWEREQISSEEVLAALTEIEPELKHEGAKVQLHKQRSTVYYAMDQFEESAEELRKGLVFNENDPEMNNNLAYILVAHLQDYQAALPYARSASGLNPNSSATLDTLGYVYLKLGEIPDALEILQRAVDMAGGEEERLVAKIHLGLAKALNGDIGGAIRELGDAERAIQESPNLGADVVEDLESLRDAVE